MQFTRHQLEKLARARAFHDGKDALYDADKAGLLPEDVGIHEGYLSDTAEILRNAFGRFAITGKVPTYPSFAALVRASWDANTSSAKAWKQENPSLGQCAVTALIIQRFFDGKIVRATAVLPDGTEDSHWYNEIAGEKIDLTADQFPAGTTYKVKGELVTLADAENYAFLNQDTRRRHDLLLERVEKAMRAAEPKPHPFMTMIGVRHVRYFWNALFNRDTYYNFDLLNRIWAGKA